MALHIVNRPNARIIDLTERAVDGNGFGSSSGPNPITGTSPVLAALPHNGEIGDFVTWGSYSSTGGAIGDPTTKQMRYDFGAWTTFVGTTQVTEGQAWQIRELVTDGTASRYFTSGVQVVADAPTNPITGTGPTLAVLTDGDTLSDAVTWGTYSPSEVIVVRLMQLNAGSWVAYNGSTQVEEGQSWAVREEVSIDTWNSDFTSVSRNVQARPLFPPVNTGQPALTGTLEVGQTLSLSNGTWNPAATSYNYRYTRNGNVISGATSNTYLLVNDDQGTTIAAQVQGVNDDGTSDWVSATGGGVVQAAPIPIPANTVPPAISGNLLEGETLSLSTGTWTPTPDEVEREWYANAAFVTNTTTLDLTGRAGQTISARVRARMTGGQWSDWTNATGGGEVASVQTVPAAFVLGDWTAVRGNQQIVVTIIGLPANGGSAITDIEYRLDGGTWTSSGGTTSFNITGLTNGVAYDVELRAVNSIGEGPASDVKPVTPAAVPAAFVTGNWSVARGDQQISVTINTLPANNGSTITDVEYRLNGGSWTSSAGVSSFVIPSLTNGVEYDIEIRAINSAGGGAASDTKSATPATVPSAFTSGQWTATPDTEQITVVVVTPPSNGGAAITDIEYRLDAGSAVSFASTTGGVISGLTDTVEYDVQIRAVNAVGAGAWSDVKAIVSGDPDSSIIRFTPTTIRGITPSPAFPAAVGGYRTFYNSTEYRAAATMGKDPYYCAVVEFFDNGEEGQIGFTDPLATTNFWDTGSFSNLKLFYGHNEAAHERKEGWNGPTIGSALSKGWHILEAFKNSSGNIVFSLNGTDAVSSVLTTTTDLDMFFIRAVNGPMNIAAFVAYDTVPVDRAAVRAWAADYIPSAENPPENLVRPAIGGIYEVGETLVVSTGTWNPLADSYSYRWTREGVPITGETSTSYLIDAADDGLTIGCQVQATNAYGSSAWVNATGSGVVGTVSFARAPWTATTRSMHSGHSLTDAYFNQSEWYDGDLVLIRDGLLDPDTEDSGTYLAKSTVGGSSMEDRWTADTVAKTGIDDYDALMITEAGPPPRLDITSPSSLTDIDERWDYWLKWCANTIENGAGNEVVLWSIWPFTNIGTGEEFGTEQWLGMSFDDALDKYGQFYETMAAYASFKMRDLYPALPNDWRVWLIPGHRFWKRIVADLATSSVPTITDLEDLFGDNIHPDSRAQYGLACLAYTCLYQTNLSTTPGVYDNPSIDDDLQEYFRQIAWEIASDYEPCGMGGEESEGSLWVEGVDDDFMPDWTFAVPDLTPGWGEIVPSSVPVNTVAPTVGGTPTEGVQLSGTNGTWTNSPDEYEYMWRIGSETEGTASTFTPGYATAGSWCSKWVRARQTGGFWSDWAEASDSGTVARARWCKLTAGTGTLSGSNLNGFCDGTGTPPEFGSIDREPIAGETLIAMWRSSADSQFICGFAGDKTALLAGQSVYLDDREFKGSWTYYNTGAGVFGAPVTLMLLPGQSAITQPQVYDFRIAPASP